MTPIFNWIAEFVCGVGIIMALTWLFNKRWWSAGNQFLALYLFFYTLLFLEQNLYWSTFYFEYPHLLLLTDPLALLLGPMLFIAINRQAKPKRPAVWLHFLPVLAVTIVYAPFYLLNSVEKIDFMRNVIWQGHDINAFRFILFRIILISQIVGYGILIQSKRTFNWKLTNLFSNKIPIDQLILASFFLYGGLRVVWLIFTFTSSYEYIFYLDASIRLITTLSILYLFIHVVSRIRIKRHDYAYSNSAIESEEVDQLKENLMRFMNQTQVYLNRDLKMIEIASNLKISEHKLSQLLNIHLGTNFFEFINRYRIEKARVLLKDPEYKKYKIETIAKECGFNSKSTFNEAFKKLEGITPSVFKKTSS